MHAHRMKSVIFVVYGAWQNALGIHAHFVILSVSAAPGDGDVSFGRDGGCSNDLVALPNRCRGDSILHISHQIQLRLIRSAIVSSLRVQWIQILNWETCTKGHHAVHSDSIEAISKVIIMFYYERQNRDAFAMAPLCGGFL